MQASLWVGSAGFFGASLMIILLLSMHATGISRTNMIRALGILFLQKRSPIAPWLGLLIHLFFGTVFAFLYAYLFSLWPPPTESALFLRCVLLGFSHGLLFGIFLTFFVSKHPFDSFQRASSDVVVAYVLGHVFYGFGVGLILASMPRELLFAFFS